MKTKLFLLSGMIFSFFSLFAQISQTPEELRERIDRFKDFTKSLQRQQLTNYERLDSVVTDVYDQSTNSFILNNMNVYLYDADNYNTSDDYRNWDATNNIMQVLSTNIYDYNTNGFISSISSFYINSGQMTPSYKLDFVYNTQNQITEQINYNWDNTNNIWTFASKETYDYTNATALPTVISTYNWDQTNNVWINNMRGTVVYDANMDMQSMQTDIWDSANNVWNNMTLTSRTYAAPHKLQEEIQQNWDATNTVWQNNYKKSYTYTPNGSGEDIFHLSQLWDSGSNTWADTSKSLATVTANNEITHVEYYYMDANTNNWAGTVKRDFIYNGAQVSVERTNWDGANSAWFSDATYKQIYQYDMNFGTSDLIIPNAFNTNSVYSNIYPNTIPNFDTFRNKILDITTYNRPTPTDTWSLTAKQFFKYSSQTSAITQADIIDAKVFPNPFTNQIRFESEAPDFDVKISDINGKQLYQSRLHFGDIIDLSFLPKGIYLYHLQAGDKFNNGKLIKN